MAHDNQQKSEQKLGRRAFVQLGLHLAVGIGGAAAFLAGRRGQPGEWVWQIDPDLCIACSNCQTHCVLDISAVKAVQGFARCGYCDVCTGYFPSDRPYDLDTGAENQLCPTAAINRRFLEEQGGNRYFEYTINEDLCIGCGKCVVGCRLMNGSLYLQVRHDRCLNCNECAIAVACPTQAFRRVPTSAPNLLPKAVAEAEQALGDKRSPQARRQSAPAPAAKEKS
jgi:electron transport complex protein RnfB